MNPNQQGAPFQGGAGRGIPFHGGPALGGPLPQFQGPGAPIQGGTGRGVSFQGAQPQGAPLQGGPVHGGGSGRGGPAQAQGPPPQLRRPRLLYEMRQAGGEMGLGLFATRNIPRGTRILSEAPILAVPRSKRDGEPSIKEKVLTFCECAIKQGVYGAKDKEAQLMELVSHEFLHGNEEVLAACWTFVTELASRVGLARSDMEGNATFFARLYSALHYNGFSETHPDGKTDTYLCTVFARINHACSPNCHPQMSRMTKQLTVHAIKDIKAGEQLFVTYINTAGAVRTKRDELLWCEHLVDCECPMCNDAGSTDVLQRELYQMYWGAFYFFNPSRRETDKVDMEVRVAVDAKEATKFCERALGVMKHPSIDLQDGTLRSIYQMLSKGYETIGEMGKAVEYAGRDVELTIAMGGPDGNGVKEADDEFRRLRQRQGDMRIPA